MLTFRRRLPVTGAAPGPGAGFARLRVATAADIPFIKVLLPLRCSRTHVATKPRPHGKTRSPDRFPPRGGPRLPQLHWTL